MSYAQRAIGSACLRIGLLCALATLLVLPTQPTRANTTYQTLPFSQNWSNTGLISANDDWSAVPGIVGYLGTDLVATTGVDPQTVLTEGTALVDVNANQTNPTVFNTGGATEFEVSNPVVALFGSNTADAPSLVLYLNTTGQSGVTVAYTLRDLDASSDNATQSFALQYRIGASGDFTNVPAGYVADATDANTDTRVTNVSAVLPAAADNQAQLQVRIITTNAVGNDEAVGVDDISVSAGGNGQITPTCAPTLETSVGTATSTGVSATDSDGIVTQAAITSGAVTGITLGSVTPAGSVGGTLNATLSVSSAVAEGSYPVVITFTNNDTTPQTATCTVTVTVNPVGGACSTTPPNLLPISAIQGSGAVSPRVNQAVSLRGIVTGDFQGASRLTGFFVQQETGDGDPATSEGVFVYVPAANSFSNVDVVVGDLVQVSGTAIEFNTLTEIDQVTALEVCGTATPPAPTDVDLPVPTNDGLERYESMLVRFPETLTVGQNFFQGRYGQVTLSGEGRLYTPTNGNGLGEGVDANLRRLLVLDDGTTAQNPNPIPYIGANNTLRAGDTTSGLTGLIDYGPINSDTSIRWYRLQPTAAVSFTRVNERPAAPEPVGGNIKVSSFNVLNYFTTIDQTGAQCFPGGTRSDCRGADSAAEFERQQTKIVNALLEIDADVFGLIEIENNGAVATNNLVAALNAEVGDGTYAAVPDPIAGGGPGGDAIKVALIYKPAVLSRVGNSISDDAAIFERPPLAQTFEVIGNGERFTVIVNHFKSKGSCPTSGDIDQGQGCWNQRRVQQAQALLGFIDEQTTQVGDDDVLVIGDLNAYGVEDPINTLTNGGLVNQSARFVPAAERYSYIFDGQSGQLDHALATASLSPQVNDVTVWHINADEPSVIDYNTEFKPQDLYDTTPYRSSDHDPVIIGLNLQAAPLDPADFSSATLTVQPTSVAIGGLVTYTLGVTNEGQIAGTFYLTDTLPSGLELVSAPGLTISGNRVTGSGLLTGGQGLSFTIVARATGPGGVTVVNQASLSGDGTTRTLTAPGVNVTGQSANFSQARKTVNRTSARVGEQLIYTLSLTNSGQLSGSYRLTDTLPLGLALVSAPGLTVNGSTLTANGTLAAAQGRQFVITVRVTSQAGATLVNRASLSGDGSIRTLTAPTVTVTRRPASFAGSTITVNRTSAAVGDVLTYTLTLSNSGELVSPFTVSDTLPSGLMVLSAPGLTISGSRVSGSGTLAAGQQQVFRITARLNSQASGTIVNQATLSGDGSTRTLTASGVRVTATVERVFLPLLRK